VTIAFDRPLFVSSGVQLVCGALLEDATVALLGAGPDCVLAR
jgi:hypothetical protein